MFDIDCSCGNRMDVDEQRTLEDFLSNVSYIRDSIGNICDVAVGTYLIYKCSVCNKEHKYKFAELEAKVRQRITQDVKEVRWAHVMRNDVHIGSIDVDNGMEFCGECTGSDGKGNCYKDIIKQCSLKGKDEL